MARPEVHRRPGIVEVAELAGVSRQTVTRAMHDMPGINEQTKQRVLEAARALRYRPSRAGRNLVKQQTFILGLVIPDLSNPYASELCSHVAKVAARHGWALLVWERPEGLGHGDQRLRDLASQVDAVFGYLKLSPALTAEDIDDAFGAMPVVSLDTLPLLAHRGRARIEIDFEPGMLLAIDHLRSVGRTDIVMVDRGYEDGVPSERMQSFVSAARRRGISPRVVPAPLEFQDDYEAGRAVAAAMAVTNDVPSAIIAFNDVLAVGMLKEFESYDVPVPGRCAVIGFDGLFIGELTTPELTTLRLDIAHIAELGVETALGLAAHRIPPDFVTRVTHHTLVVRRSA